MIRLPSLRRDAARAPSSRAVRPCVEGLEDRQLLSSVNGGKWSYGSRITYSFVPDGTSIGGISSNLFQTLNSKFATAAWVQAFTRAAAVWQQVANINLALVPDSGDPIGASGYQQDDPRFGDIRIGAYPQANGQLGIAILPPPINGGAAAGDIFINSNVAWQINSDYDLQTVAIHELGHALGLGHSSITNATQYNAYTWMKQALYSDDIAGIQSIYGATPGEGVNNNTASTAVNVTTAPGQAQSSIGGQVINTTSDVDWFKVTVPSNTTGTMVVAMQSSVLSALSPRLAVYNAAQAALGQSLAANVYGTTVYFTVNNVSPGQVYYIRASAANTGPGSTGGYGISVNFGAGAQETVDPPNTTVLQQPDQGSGSSAMTTQKSSSLLGLGLSLNNGLSLNVNLIGIELGLKLQIGTLSVYAEPMMAGQGGKHRGPRRNLGSGSLIGHHPRIHNGQFTVKPSGARLHQKP